MLLIPKIFMIDNNSNLIYSTNHELNKQCTRCKKPIVSCSCPKQPSKIDISKIKVLIRLERKHRGGKDVTIIERLPPSEEFLKNLSGELKRKCGSGGTFKIIDGNGIIEIQGDKITQIRSELEKIGIKCK
jgi:translation initiation factor 1